MARQEQRSSSDGANSLIPICLCLSVIIWILFFIGAVYLVLENTIDLTRFLIIILGATIPFLISACLYRLVYPRRDGGGLRLFAPKAVLAISEGRGESCMICVQEIEAGEPILTCPHCEGKAHRRHLVEWVKTKGNCPMCRRNIRAS